MLKLTVLVLVVGSGCGRLGFDVVDGVDAMDAVDAAGDTTPDAPPVGTVFIDGVLGYRDQFIAGSEGFAREEQARLAALLALSPGGWNLAALGGVLDFYGPPAWSSSTGEVEWVVGGFPAAMSDAFGYSLNPEATMYGDRRYLVFHTDATVMRSAHDIGEPSGFGLISGTMDGFFLQVGVKDWGSFGVR